MQVATERDIKEIFRQDVRQANLLVDLLFILVSFGATAGLIYYFQDYIGLFFNNFDSASQLNDVKLLIGALAAFVPIGYIMGLFWVAFTWILLRLLYIQPIKAAKDKKNDLLQFSGILAKLLFSENLKNAFIRLEAPDMDYRKLLHMLRFSRRFVLTYISLFYIALYYVLDIFRNEQTNDFSLVLMILVSMLIAFVGTGLYLPINLVTEDARIMVLQDNGQFITTKVDLFDYIDRFLVFSGLVLGYHMLSREFVMRNVFTDSVTLLLVYFLFTIGIVIVIAPAFYPAVLAYRNMHARLVNNFRKELLESGLEVAMINRSALVKFIPKEELLGDDKAGK